MKCEECQNLASEVCLECEENLCNFCSQKLHNGGKRRLHNRRKICEACGTIASFFCCSCEKANCSRCVIRHLTHEVISTSRPIIYLDLACALDLQQIQMILAKMSIQMGTLKVYSRNMKSLQVSNNFSVIFRPFQFASMFFNDLENDMRLGMSEFFIISDEIRKDKICDFSTFASFYLFDRFSFSFAPLGPFFIIRFLLNKFLEGRLLLEYQQTAAELAVVARLDVKTVEKMIENQEKLGNILIVSKEFNQFKLKQIGLKVEEINAKVFLSVLRSLKIDEMFPCEKAIQSRIREIFSIKFHLNDWSGLIQKMQNVKIQPDFSLFSQDLPLFQFQQILYEEEKSFAVYPKGEQWASSDQFGDLSLLKTSQEWRVFIDFLSSFFEKDTNSSLSGGKYGCALMVKHFAPQVLQKLSIGKLIFMIQTAVNDDILRYQKTLLVWSENQQSALPEDLIQERLAIIRQEINKMLKNKPAGVPLAQIPINLKRRLKFNLKLNDLGFKKLKDLLKAFPEVSLFPEQSKNPSAFLNLHRVKVSSIESFIVEVVEKNTFSVSETSLVSELRKEFGEISWSSYGCSGLIEFVDLKVKKVNVMKTGKSFIFIGRESEEGELSISTHNSEYLGLVNNEDSDDVAFRDEMVEFLSN